MGKGDKKSKKGKRTIGSFGVSRNRNKIKARLKRSTVIKAAVAAETEPKSKRTPRKKAEA
jgi:ribosomal small subunit protein bTHX